MDEFRHADEALIYQQQTLMSRWPKMGIGAGDRWFQPQPAAYERMPRPMLMRRWSTLPRKI